MTTPRSSSRSTRSTRSPLAPLLDCWPTIPLIDATVPATGARRIVSSSFFCADATCSFADVTAACCCASCSGLGASCFTATLATADWYCSWAEDSWSCAF